MRSSSQSHDLVLILDYGSQYTHLITRRLRSLSVFSLCISGGGACTLQTITDLNPRVIILSGGPHSVTDPDAPAFPDGFIEHVRSKRVHVLGICYGMQLMVHKFGGSVRVGVEQEYGTMEIEILVDGEGLFGDFTRKGDTQVVQMSHADEVVESELPPGFEVVAKSQHGVVAAVRNRELRFYGLQYHPEVTHSTKGLETLRNFLFNVCGIKGDWKMKDVLSKEIKDIQNTVGADEHVICALSGGVDSTVAATLVHKAIGDRLHCVFVDSGLLRHKERERVMDTFEKYLHLPVTLIDASERFLSKLKGVKDGEAKRKIIGNEFICIFDEFAEKLEIELGKKPSYLVQGTLYPDVIESCPPPGSKASHSHTIKSHHNVGGLPKDMKLKLIEPLRLLFKDEVRELGKCLNVPEGFLKRHPFPGPGLAVRIAGDVTEVNKLEIVRQADEIFVECITDAGLYDSMFQALVYMDSSCTSVGTQGDRRTSCYSVTVRAVTSEDGMTAEGYAFPEGFIDGVTRKICNKVRGVNRVKYDPTPKPPATIEFE